MNDYDLHTALAESESERMEQARLLGISGSKELRLITILEENKKLAGQATSLIIDEKIDEALELLYKIINKGEIK